MKEGRVVTAAALIIQESTKTEKCWGEEQLLWVQTPTLKLDWPKWRHIIRHALGFPCGRVWKETPKLRNSRDMVKVRHWPWRVTVGIGRWAASLARAFASFCNLLPPRHNPWIVKVRIREVFDSLSSLWISFKTQPSLAACYRLSEHIRHFPTMQMGSNHAETML